MSVKFETLKPGDMLYDCHMRKLGNTTMSAMGIWTIEVKSINGDYATVLCDGRRTRLYHRSMFGSSAIRRAPPEWYHGCFNGKRCYFCGAMENSGHRSNCEHPKARSARRRAAA